MALNWPSTTTAYHQSLTRLTVIVRASTKPNIPSRAEEGNVITSESGPWSFSKSNHAIRFTCRRAQAQQRNGLLKVSESNGHPNLQLTTTMVEPRVTRPDCEGIGDARGWSYNFARPRSRDFVVGLKDLARLSHPLAFLKQSRASNLPTF